jgi:hypothetical protein
LFDEPAVLEKKTRVGLHQGAQADGVGAVGRSEGEAFVADTDLGRGLGGGGRLRRAALLFLFEFVEPLFERANLCAEQLDFIGVRRADQ